MRKLMREWGSVYRFECWYATMQGDTLTPQVRLRIVWSMLREAGQSLVCRWRGHAYAPDGCDYPEDGGEGFTCQRCGHSFTAWH